MMVTTSKATIGRMFFGTFSYRKQLQKIVTEKVIVEG